MYCRLPFVPEYVYNLEKAIQMSIPEGYAYEVEQCSEAGAAPQSRW